MLDILGLIKSVQNQPEKGKKTFSKPMRAPSEAMITAETWTTPKREKVKSWGCTFGAMKLTNFFFKTI